MSHHLSLGLWQWSSKTISCCHYCSPTNLSPLSSLDDDIPLRTSQRYRTFHRIRDKVSKSLHHLFPMLLPSSAPIPPLVALVPATIAPTFFLEHIYYMSFLGMGPCYSLCLNELSLETWIPNLLLPSCLCLNVIL